MEQDLVDYVISNYTNLFTEKERAAYRHHHTLMKHEDASPRQKEIMLKFWGTNNQETLKLLHNGYDAFARTVAERILKENIYEIIINNCPHCGKLARTPLAKQCRFCGFDWH